MSTQLFDDLVRLASENEEYQGPILGLLERHASTMGKEALFGRKKKKPGGGSYKDYVADKKKKGEKPLSKEEWESKVQGKGKDKGDAKSEKAKKKLLSKGILKVKMTPENVAAAGKELLKQVKGDALDLARKHSGKELKKLESQLRDMEKASKGAISVSREMKQVIHAQNMKSRGIGKKAALEAYLYQELVRVAKENPGPVRDDILRFLAPRQERLSRLASQVTRSA